METKDEEIREKLRLEMVGLQTKAIIIKGKIAKIDSKNEQARRDNVFGKCFKFNDAAAYVRVEGFSNNNTRPLGTKVVFYGLGENKRFSISFNDDIWFEDIEGADQIPDSQFNEYLLQAQELVKLKIKK